MVYTSIIIRSSLLYEFKNQLKATEAARKIRNAFGESSVTDDTARFWFRRFKGGNENLEDEPRVGRPIVCSDDQIRQHIFENPRSTCSEISLGLNCDASTIRKRLNAMNFVKKSDKWEVVTKGDTEGESDGGTSAKRRRCQSKDAVKEKSLVKTKSIRKGTGHGGSPKKQEDFNSSVCADDNDNLGDIHDKGKAFMTDPA
ncbi:histone-lysine N-methyltransferase SETMAR-like isoform X2 [Rhynchophorus ferrugineus]